MPGLSLLALLHIDAQQLCGTVRLHVHGTHVYMPCRTLRHRSNLAAAGDSDTRLEAKLASNAAGFAALTVDAAASQMPRLQVHACLRRQRNSVGETSPHEPNRTDRMHTDVTTFCTVH